ncbi:hypothetical protein FOCC_FOCC005200, partial [Frankliniella occidentalis]
MRNVAVKLIPSGLNFRRNISSYVQQPTSSPGSYKLKTIVERAWRSGPDRVMTTAPHSCAPPIPPAHSHVPVPVPGAHGAAGDAGFMQHSCWMCGKSSATHRDNVTHMMTHLNEHQPYLCMMCGQRFPHGHLMSQHVAAHEQYAAIANAAAGASATTGGSSGGSSGSTGSGSAGGSGTSGSSSSQAQENGRSSEERVTNTQGSQFHPPNPCPSQSQRTPSQSQTAECETCGRRDLVGSHRLGHDDKPFNCSSCSKGFVWKSDFTKHQMMHSGEKPFKCDLCTKGFISKSDLSKHQMIHVGEKPFKCHLCGKGFVWKSDL